MSGRPYHGSRKESSRYEPAKGSLAGFVELRADYGFTPQEFLEALCRVEYVCGAAWVKALKNLNGFENSVMEGRIQVMPRTSSSHQDSPCIEFELTRFGHMPSPPAPNTMTVWFREPPQDLHAVAWLILYAVTAGRQLEPEYVWKYATDVLAKSGWTLPYDRPMSWSSDATRGDLPGLASSNSTNQTPSNNPAVTKNLIPLAEYCVKSGFLHWAEDLCRQREYGWQPYWKEESYLGMISVPSCLIRNKPEYTLFKDEHVAVGGKEARLEWLAAHEHVFTHPGNSDYQLAMKTAIEASAQTDLTHLKSRLSELGPRKTGEIARVLLRRCRASRQHGAAEADAIFEALLSFEDLVIGLIAKDGVELNQALTVRSRSLYGGPLVTKPAPVFSNPTEPGFASARLLMKPGFPRAGSCESAGICPHSSNWGPSPTMGGSYPEKIVGDLTSSSVFTGHGQKQPLSTAQMMGAHGLGLGQPSSDQGLLRGSQPQHWMQIDVQQCVGVQVRIDQSRSNTCISINL